MRFANQRPECEIKRAGVGDQQRRLQAVKVGLAPERPRGDDARHPGHEIRPVLRIRRHTRSPAQRGDKGGPGSHLRLQRDEGHALGCGGVEVLGQPCRIRRPGAAARLEHGREFGQFAAHHDRQIRCAGLSSARQRSSKAPEIKAPLPTR